MFCNTRKTVVGLLSMVTTICQLAMVDSMALSASAADRFVGFDLGTSGARISVVEKSSLSHNEVHSDAISWDSENRYDDPNAWNNAIHKLLSRAAATASKPDLLSTVKSICVSGTSASCLLVDSRTGEVTRHPRMYDFDVTTDSYGKDAMTVLSKYAPPRHTANTNTGSFAKLLRWNAHQPIQPNEMLCHQADYVVMNLLYGDDSQCKQEHSILDKRREVRSDWHNCLKLGYDVQNLCWPDWMLSCLDKELSSFQDAASFVLPDKVVSPGQPIGALHPIWIERYGLSQDALLVGGTTDSNAAFFAAVGGASPEFGTAVTSLGSTLAIKMLSKSFVEDASRGVYSHRFPVFDGSCKDNHEGQENEEAWLVGGASNVGCAVLRQEQFSNSELIELSQQIDPMQDSPLSYYPLTKKGERFPVADSERKPLLVPKPENRKEYLHGILQGISDVECQGFDALGSLGASPPKPCIVWSCGGGAKNDMWLKMRERKIADICGREAGAKVCRAENTEASFGSAILAAATFN